MADITTQNAQDPDVNEPREKGFPAAEAYAAAIRDAVAKLSDEDLLDGIPEDELGLNGWARTYLAEIGKFLPLSSRQEADLIAKIKAGEIAAAQLDEAEEADGALDEGEQRRLSRARATGDEAREQLIESNLRAVACIARRFVGGGVSFTDLVYEGNSELATAIEAFDDTKGVEFFVYAAWRVRLAIERAVKSHGHVMRLPKDVRDILHARSELARELGRYPLPDEVAEKTGLPLERVREVLKAAFKPLELDAPLTDEEAELDLNDYLEEPPDDEELARMKEQLEDALKSLGERGSKYIRLRFGLDDGRIRTRAEAAQELNLTRERVRQIEAKFFAKMRKHRDPSKLDDQLDD